jgi:hypothetical protein
MGNAGSRERRPEGRALDTDEMQPDADGALRYGPASLAGRVHHVVDAVDIAPADGIAAFDESWTCPGLS